MLLALVERPVVVLRRLRHLALDCPVRAGVGDQRNVGTLTGEHKTTIVDACRRMNIADYGGTSWTPVRVDMAASAYGFRACAGAEREPMDSRRGEKKQQHVHT
jgi:hypothetical protein